MRGNDAWWFTPPDDTAKVMTDCQHTTRCDTDLSHGFWGWSDEQCVARGGWGAVRRHQRRLCRQVRSPPPLPRTPRYSWSPTLNWQGPAADSWSQWSDADNRKWRPTGAAGTGHGDAHGSSAWSGGGNANHANHHGGNGGSWSGNGGGSWSGGAQ